MEKTINKIRSTYKFKIDAYHVQNMVPIMKWVENNNGSIISLAYEQEEEYDNIYKVRIAFTDKTTDWLVDYKIDVKMYERVDILDKRIIH